MPAQASRAAGADPLRVEVRRIIARPVEEVFRAWITPASIARWLGGAGTSDVRVSGAARPGGRIRVDLVYNGAPWFLDGEYLEVDPPRRLVHTWRPSWDNYAVTTVEYDLQPTASGTRLLVTHSGFGERAQEAAGTCEGWTRVLEWLGDFITAWPA